MTIEIIIRIDDNKNDQHTEIRLTEQMLNKGYDANKLISEAIAKMKELQEAK